MHARHLLLGSSLLLAALVLAGCSQRSSVAEGTALAPEDINLGGTTYHVSGPYSHDNLAVYLIHSVNGAQDESDYLTLDQGLKEGLVKVTEKDQEQVNELQIENCSDRPLFLQEGDRLTGGRQDRTLFSSLVIPPKSGKMPIPTFCIEHGRWTEGASGKDFQATANAAFAPKEVREAAKVGKAQSEVWRAVEYNKGQATAGLAAPNTNSSLNESLETEKVKKICDESAAALKDPLEQHPNAVGVALVVNGKIEEINLYPNHKLLGKLYPRLIQAYAFQAATTKDQAKDAPKVAAAEVVQFMNESGEKKTLRDEAVNGDNHLRVRALDEYRCACETTYQGKEVHHQYMSKTPFAAQAPANQPGVQQLWNSNSQPASQSPDNVPQQPSPPAQGQQGGGQAGQPPTPPAQPPAPPAPPKQ